MWSNALPEIAGTMDWKWLSTDAESDREEWLYILYKGANVRFDIVSSPPIWRVHNEEKLMFVLTALHNGRNERSRPFDFTNCVHFTPDINVWMPEDWITHPRMSNHKKKKRKM